MMPVVKLAVRELVEAVLRRGSIETSGLVGSNRMLLGTIAHKKVQQSMDAHYESEVPLIYETTYEEITFIIEGRVDGIIRNLVGITIDEIKSTYTPLDEIDEGYNIQHWAQAKCYAYIYAMQQGLKEVDVRLTYYNLTTKKMKHLVRSYQVEKLEDFFIGLLKAYAKGVKWQSNWAKERNASLKKYQFPFSTYRKGQREMAGTIYKSIIKNTTLYVNAPTGTGKTISTLFPAVKAMGEGYLEKIFYITAKTITRKVAEDTIEKMHQGGAYLKSITLTAKDKICLIEGERKCSKAYCKFADGHFDRVDEAIWDALTTCDRFTRDKIKEYAKKHCVCPFELALDLTYYMDIIVCDYNHIFDPVVALKRFQEDKENKFVILIDEAHNLTERAREMFSKGISSGMIQYASKAVPRSFTSIKQALKKIEKYFIQVECMYLVSGSYMSKEAPEELKSLIRLFIEVTDAKLQEGIGELPTPFIDFYFEMQRFLKIYELFDERYVTYAERRGKEIYLKMFCLDPSFLVKKVVDAYQSTIFFSATLLPIQYYKYMLGGIEDKAISVPSIFESSQSLRLVATDISTRYHHRNNSYMKIAQYIYSVVHAKKGNYMVFFPSYDYMIKCYEAFLETYRGYKVVVQEVGMTDTEKEEFLARFEETPLETTIGFCVLGGNFSEGIDLTGDKLIGVIVVGVGLPQVGTERNLIKYYFDELNLEGYHYAYTYPGMNKVLQGIGRLIRTKEDYGIILLIDDRYNTPLYRALLPIHLLPVVTVTQETIESELVKFWADTKK